MVGRAWVPESVCGCFPFETVEAETKPPRSLLLMETAGRSGFGATGLDVGDRVRWGWVKVPVCAARVAPLHKGLVYLVVLLDSVLERGGRSVVVRERVRLEVGEFEEGQWRWRSARSRRHQGVGRARRPNGEWE